MYSVNKYDIKTLYWELSADKDLIEAEKDAIKELLSLDLQSIILDISFLNSDYILYEILKAFINKSDCKISIRADKNAASTLLKVFESPYATNIEKITLMIDDILPEEINLMIKKAKKINIIIEAYVLVDCDNYYQMEDIFLETYKLEVNFFTIQIKRFGYNTLKAETLFEFIRSFTYLVQYFQANINIVSFENVIENICKKTIVDKIYIDNNGYIGTSEILPTFFENIIERKILECWNRYIFLYLNQSLMFYIKKFGLDSTFKTKNVIKKECLENGYFSSKIPHISKQWKFLKNKDNTYVLKNMLDESEVNINSTGVSILNNIHRDKSIYDIMKAIAVEYSDVIESKLYYDVVTYINTLARNKMIVYKDKVGNQNESFVC